MCFSARRARSSIHTAPPRSIRCTPNPGRAERPSGHPQPRIMCVVGAESGVISSPAQHSRQPGFPHSPRRADHHFKQTSHDTSQSRPIAVVAAAAAGAGAAGPDSAGTSDWYLNTGPDQSGAAARRREIRTTSAHTQSGWLYINKQPSAVGRCHPIGDGGRRGLCHPSLRTPATQPVRRAQLTASAGRHRSSLQGARHPVQNSAPGPTRPPGGEGRGSTLSGVVRTGSACRTMTASVWVPFRHRTPDITHRSPDN